MACPIRNTPGQMIHRSGSVIDVVAASTSLRLTVQVVRVGDGRVRSDHARLDVVCESPVMSPPRHMAGRARRGADGDWNAALSL
eukprot:6347310-Pyramimonas_sp.AAC.1